MSYDREYVLELLKQNVCFVTFTKVDGTQRKMLATLRQDLLPDRDRTEVEHPYPADVIRCYDLDAKNWRSFRMDRLIGVALYTDDTDPSVTINVTVTEEESADLTIIPAFVDAGILSSPMVGGGTFDGGGASGSWQDDPPVQPAPEPDIPSSDSNPVSFDPDPPSFDSAPGVSSDEF